MKYNPMEILGCFTEIIELYTNQLPFKILFTRQGHPQTQPICFVTFQQPVVGMAIPLLLKGLKDKIVINETVGRRTVRLLIRTVANPIVGL
jgi:hypothetical protein